MRFLKIFLIVVPAILVVLIGFVAYRYFTLSPREKAERWYAAQGAFPQGSYEEQWCLAQAIKADSSFAKAYMEKSIAHNKRGDYAEGFALLDQAVALSSIEYLGYRGYVKMYMLRDYAGAIADWELLDTLTPGLTDAPWGDDIYYALGLARKQSGDYEGALREFDRSIAGITAERGEEWIEVRTFLYRGLTLAALGRHEEAIFSFERGLEQYESFSEAWFYRGISLLQLNRTEEACESWMAALEKFDAGYLFTNNYYELPDQVYRSDITEAIADFCSSD